MADTEDSTGEQTHRDRRIVPVLAGGGARLPAHIGILAALDKLRIEFDELVGVSGGSIVAALLASGYGLREIRKISDETDFSEFLGTNILSLLRTGGLSSGDHFERWIDSKLDGRCFRDLERELHVVATDVKSGRPVVFSSTSTPDLPVSQAVRYSMSVPLLFSFKNHGDQVMADGSILSEEALRRDWSGRGTPVVVFKLRGSGGIEFPDRKPLLPLRQYLAMLLHTFMTTLSHEYINEDFWLSTIVVETGDISPVAFSLGIDVKDRLYDIGYRSTLDYLPVKLERQRPMLTGWPDSAD